MQLLKYHQTTYIKIVCNKSPHILKMLNDNNDTILIDII